MYSFRKEVVKAISEKAKTYLCAPLNRDSIDDRESGKNIKNRENAKSRDNREISYWNEIGCTFINYDFDRHGRNPLKELKHLHFYEKLLQEIKPDIVFTYTIKPNIYGGIACASMGIPYVANITGLGTAIENGGITHKVAILLYKFALRKAQKVFFQNSENRDFMLSHGIGRKAYALLPGSGVNLNEYRPSPYPNDEKTINFIFVGRIMKEKGIDQYLEAAKVIRQRHPETQFHIYGSFEQNNYERILKSFIDDGSVIYHDSVFNMKPVYQMAACTIHPTYYPEGLSNVLLESAASGRPIITTNRSGCREIVDDDVNGYVVKQQDSEDLIEKIEKFLNLSWEDRRRMGLSGRAKVEREFDRNIVIKKYIDEIKAV